MNIIKKWYPISCSNFLYAFTGKLITIKIKSFSIKLPFNKIINFLILVLVKRDALSFNKTYHYLKIIITDILIKGCFTYLN